jgi:hypothetical protein
VAAGQCRGAPARAASREREIAELGGDEITVAFALDRLCDERFVHTGAIRVGSDEQVHAELERAVHRRDRFLVVRLAVADRHAHAAQTLRGHIGTIPA